jgi:hypothetical protein
MKNQLSINIANSNAIRANRVTNTELVLSNIELFPDLLELALNTENKNYHKACWILELVLEKQLSLITDFLPVFCQCLNTFKHESAIRAIAKICLFITKHLELSSIEEKQIAESCFDWIIDVNKKVASKAYAIRALYELGKKYDWINPELERILTNDYSKHSSAYKAVAREILKKIK